MNYGPLEFAAYLQRSDVTTEDSAAIRAARSAAPADTQEMNQLTIVSGRKLRAHVAREARVEAVSVYEAVAMRAPCSPVSDTPVKVLVRATRHPVVLVLSSHQTVRWELELAPGAVLNAVLLSGYGASTVAGAGEAIMSSIGGFYAFKRGSAEYRHLESEVMRCTGRNIENFQSMYAGNSFEIGAE